MLNNSRTRPVALALAATLAATATVPAYAAKEGASVAVQYADLDLTSEQGQKALAGRLDRAAREVCGIGETVTGSRLPARSSRTCYQETREKLAQQIARVVGEERRGG